MIEILSNGAPNVVQDLGREGYLGLGVCRSGAMDSIALGLANALVGNEDGAAGIEINLFPFRLRFRCEAMFACTGGDSAVNLDDKFHLSWWRRRASPGQTLVIERPKKSARAYLAFAGGIDVPIVMGSRSTDLKSGFGGWGGRGLKRGDVLPLGLPSLTPKVAPFGLMPVDRPAFTAEVERNEVGIRVLLAAEHDAFSAESTRAFRQGRFVVTPDANRTGYRLSGPSLLLDRKLELLSHGIVPGTIQVPPSGQPIIQMAEANTCGGYPKIATVIEADLWRVAQAPAGCALTFRSVDEDEALDALRALRGEYDILRENLAFVAGWK